MVRIELRACGSLICRNTLTRSTSCASSGPRKFSPSSAAPRRTIRSMRRETREDRLVADQWAERWNAKNIDSRWRGARSKAAGRQILQRPEANHAQHIGEWRELAERHQHVLVVDIERTSYIAVTAENSERVVGLLLRRADILAARHADNETTITDGVCDDIQRLGPFEQIVRQRAFRPDDDARRVRRVGAGQRDESQHDLFCDAGLVLLALRHASFDESDLRTTGRSIWNLSQPPRAPAPDRAENNGGDDDRRSTRSGCSPCTCIGERCRRGHCHDRKRGEAVDTPDGRRL